MEVNTRTAELSSEQGNTDFTVLVVIDETTQCGKCKEHNAKGKPFLHRWSNSAGVISKKHKSAERNNAAGHDSLDWFGFAVANQDKRSDKAPQSRNEGTPRREASFPKE